MKKIINFTILGIFIFIVAVSIYILTRNEVEIPREMVIDAVKLKFPIEKSQYRMCDFKLSDPTVYIENDKIVIETDYEYLDNVRKINGKARFEGELMYKNSNLHLWMLKLKKLTKDGKDIEEAGYGHIMTGNTLIQLESEPLLYLGNNKKFASLEEEVRIRNNKIMADRKNAMNIF